jgi:hypothetical protein
VATVASIVNALQRSLVGTVGAATTVKKAATVGNNAGTANTHIRPAKVSGSENDTHFNRLSNFQIENGKLATAGAANLTRATAQTEISTFCVGLQLSTFRNDNLYNNLSTIGSSVALQMKFSADATAASTINCYSFFNQIVVLDPVTRQYSIQSM